MSALSEAVMDKKLRDEARARPGAKNIGNRDPLYDFGENGWPKDEVVDRLNDGAKYGKGSAHWESVAHGGNAYLSMELRTANGFVQVVMDPQKNKAAFAMGGEVFEGDFDQIGTAMALASKRSSAINRSADSVAARSGAWQPQAVEALIAADSGRARFHAKAKEDPADSWERQFDAIDAHCEKCSNPIEELDKIRAGFMGSKPADVEKLMAEAIADKSKWVGVAGERAAVVAMGIQGAQMRIAIPVKENGTVKDNLPMMAVMGRVGDSGAFELDSNAEPMRFYHKESVAKWASSAQGTMMAEPEGSLTLGKLAKWRDAREAAPEVSVKPQAPKA